MRRVLFVCLSGLLGAACSGSPESPTTPTAVAPPAPPPPTVATIAGTWSGNMSFTFHGQPHKCLGTLVKLTQAERTIQGTWELTAPPDNDIRGAITGTLEGVGADTAFRGTVTWNGASADPAIRCTGRASFAGSSGTNPMQWHAAGFTIDNCGDPGMSEITWTLALGSMGSRCRDTSAIVAPRVTAP